MGSRIVRERGFFESLRLGISLLKSKLRFRRARLVRFPIYIRGRKYIDLGKSLTTGVGCRIEAFRLSGSNPPVLKFGSRVQLNDYVHICALQSIVIGDDVLMASHVYISDNSHGVYKGTGKDSSPEERPIEREYFTAPVEIGSRAWIGEGVMILPGVKIGEGAVIGAHSVVNRDIPSGCIAVGSPARVIKKYNNISKRWERISKDI
ncbi:MAG: acetyltransferase [Muribaculaceae bacterium]|nr:acetyltransferase [Muribaculaceae bacterium]MDE6682759.1 acetyltransferase [Muribaculaceae bacterium]